MGHLRRGDIGGMSAVDPIATDLLHYASGRKGPLATFRSAEKLRAFSPPSHRRVYRLPYVIRFRNHRFISENIRWIHGRTTW